MPSKARNLRRVTHSDALDRFNRTGKEYAIRPRSYREPEILRSMKLKEQGDKPGFFARGKDVIGGKGEVKLMGKSISFEDMALIVRSWMITEED